MSTYETLTSIRQTCNSLARTNLKMARAQLDEGRDATLYIGRTEAYQEVVDIITDALHNIAII